MKSFLNKTCEILISFLHIPTLTGIMTRLWVKGREWEQEEKLLRETQYDFGGWGTTTTQNIIRITKTSHTPI